MKLQNGVSRKMRYGSASVGITAAVICGVLLLNILATALCSNFLWHIDLTPEPLYTLADETEFLLEQSLSAVDAERDPKDPVQVKIIFCADPDVLCANERTRPVYYTALELQKAFPKNITVTTEDVWDNPSSVDAYRTNAYSSIYPSQVIVASGSEFRLYNNDAFYSFYSDNLREPFAYNGEKTFVKGILAVTRAEAPICALTVNHGEPFATEEGKAEYSELLRVIEAAERLMHSDPFSPQNLNILTFAYGKLGNRQMEQVCYDRFTKVMQTIESSGTGRREDSPWHVLTFQHAADFTAWRGGEINNRQVRSRSVEYIQLKVKDAAGNRGYFFDFSRVYMKRPEVEKPKEERRWKINDMPIN